MAASSREKYSDRPVCFSVSHETIKTNEVTLQEVLMNN
jgi:hypothetical protein